MTEVLFVLNLCDRWGKTPEEIYALDPDVLYLLDVESIYREAKARVASLGRGAGG